MKTRAVEKKTLWRWSWVLLALVLVAQGALAAEVAAPQTRHTFEIGLVLNSFDYEEPDPDVELNGTMYGVKAQYAFHWYRGLMIAADAEYTYGEPEYDGGFFDGTPIERDSEDYIFETRVVGGWDFYINPNFILTPYAGIGYRYWNNDVEGSGSYERETEYVYSPLGVTMSIPMGQHWRWGMTFEYDLFWAGTNESAVSDVDAGYNDVEFDLDDGYGFRASMSFGTRHFAIEPYFVYWEIDDSDTDTLTYNGVPLFDVIEPENETTIWGVRLNFRF
jgi:hypothetical protein